MHFPKLPLLVLFAARCFSSPVYDPSSRLSFPSLSNHNYGDTEQNSFTDPPRVPLTPSGEGQGWLARWLSMGGEGVVTVFLGDSNFTLPHRPAAFPSHLNTPIALPIRGFLKSFPMLPAPPSPSKPAHDDTSSLAYLLRFQIHEDSFLACVPPIFPPLRYIPPEEPYTIALVERGSCDFATKIRAAQERGAAAVIVGDGRARTEETEAEGRARDNLITMFSPEDTDSIFIPSVFVSRASYLGLMDMLGNGTDTGRPEGEGLWVDLSEGSDEGGALSSLLSFALLMPSLFLLATIAVHRIRMARQREADRAPPLVVLSLPERVWTPDIVWEKDDSDESDQGSPTTDGPPPISPAEVRTPPAVSVPVPDPLGPPPAGIASGSERHKPRTKSTAKKYFSKDECAICMDAFQRGDIVRILPCGHVFHKDECDEWLLKWRKLCPTCRADVTLPPGTDVPGVSFTPVAPAADPAASLNPRPTPLVLRLTAAFSAARGRLFGGRVRLDEEVGETTPLISRSRSASDVTVRQGEGTV